MRLSALILWFTSTTGVVVDIIGVARRKPLLVLSGACLTLPFLLYVLRTNIWYAGVGAVIGNIGAAAAVGRERSQLAWWLIAPLVAVFTVVALVLLQSEARMHTYPR